MESGKKLIAVIVAGGRGLRMNSKIKKQYMNFAGLPVLTRTVQVFTTCSCIDDIVLVVPEQDMDFCHDDILLPYGLDGKVIVVPGGDRRQDSVKNGLIVAEELTSSLRNTLVLIHDGVRPFTDHLLIKRCIAGALEHHGACVPALSVHDTLKKSDGQGFVSDTVARDNIYQVQTPQVFDLDIILAAHDYAEKEHFSGTDDASLVEKLGEKVFITRGSKKNFKITTKGDLDLAVAFFTQGHNSMHHKIKIFHK